MEKNRPTNAETPSTASLGLFTCFPVVPLAWSGLSQSIKGGMLGQCDHDSRDQGPTPS